MNPNKRLLRPWVGALGASLLVGGLAGGLDAQQGHAGHAAQPSQAQALGVDTSAIDRSVRPQDDFYRFANGAWLRRTQIPADRASYAAFTELAERSETALRAIIEEAAASPNRTPGSNQQKVGDLFLSFMDSARIESLGIQPLERNLRQIRTLSNRQELPELFADLQKIGVQTPIGFSVQQDQKQATRYIATASQSGLGLPDRDYYLRQEPRLAETRTAYLGYIETLLRLAGERDPAAGARNILALETALAEKHWDRARSRDREATYNLKSEAELGQLTPGFSWSKYLDALDAEQTPGVVVRQPDYFQAMDQILARTPLETLRQYLTFKLVDAYAPSLSSPFVEARFAFRGRALQGQQQNRPRWKRGVDVVEGALGHMVGRMYVERHFRPEQKARMEQLVANVVAAFREGIDQLEWMSPETKAQAKAKLSRFTVKIGYPDQWRDYSALEIRPGDLVGNVRRASEFAFRRAVDRLGKPIDRTEWAMTPQTVNAYYSSTMNEIVFPAAILQPPFFNPEADDAVNYGAIGAVIGHEISHGFDDQGRRSDGEGNLRDWWTEADNAAFQQRANALVEQYSGYSPVEGLNVNGRLTLGENIGDLSGLAVAYKAYRRSLNGREAPVIGGFTGDQRFFLGWAQVWRALFREEALRQQLLTDPHSPGEYRTNGVLRNMPEFYAAFGVKEGDRMYLSADKRVKIW
ncbi:MAG TPA: M13-type metalloendopeptidase [Longimicrobiaceae bacterium]|nr:M13-type metalloendopeptidase [Longimicrobiaceae bacterium]